MLTVWGRATSSNVQAVMWCVGELGLDHVRHDLGHTHGGLDTPEFRALNPHGLIPVIRDETGGVGAAPVWETAAIVRYLAARYGRERLGDAFWPADPAARARVDMWAHWAKESVAARFTVPVFWAVVRTPAAKRDPVAIARGVRQLGRELDTVEARLAENEWLAGGHFTPADIMLGHVLYRYFDIDIARKPRPALDAYYARLQDRPAFREHVCISYESLRA